jgi:hypothetical protein
MFQESTIRSQGRNSRRHHGQEFNTLQLEIRSRALPAVAILVLAATGAIAGEAGERRGEIGIQLGLRRLDSDIVPPDSGGTNIAWGIEGAWALNDRWAIFGDVNTSEHDSIELCEGAEGCFARTPVVELNMVTVGIERRLRPGPKGGRWVWGVGTGMEDLRWNGVRIHHGILSLNFSRRMRLGPGAARVTLRADTSFSGRTDNQLEGGFDKARITNVALLVGWGFGFGGRL